MIQSRKCEQLRPIWSGNRNGRSFSPFLLIIHSAAPIYVYTYAMELFGIPEIAATSQREESANVAGASEVNDTVHTPKSHRERDVKLHSRDSFFLFELKEKKCGLGFYSKENPPLATPKYMQRRFSFLSFARIKKDLFTISSISSSLKKVHIITTASEMPFWLPVSLSDLPLKK